MKPVVSRK